jgi:glucose-6-phosphate dehydrogenase assembly protein OpcA
MIEVPTASTIIRMQRTSEEARCSSRNKEEKMDHIHSSVGYCSTERHYHKEVFALSKVEVRTEGRSKV